MEEKKEELKTENNGNSKLTLIIIGIVLMLIGGCIGFFVGKGFTNEKENKKEEEKNTTNEYVEVTDLDNVYINGEKVDFELVRSNDFPLYLNINGKRILDFEVYEQISYVYTTGDAIFFAFGGDYGGPTELYYVSKNGDIIRNIKTSELNMNYIFELKPVNDHVHIHTVVFYDGSLFYIGEERKTVDACDADSLKKEGISDDYIVEADYDIYYKNGKVEVKLVPGSEKTVKQFREKNCDN